MADGACIFQIVLWSSSLFLKITLLRLVSSLSVDDVGDPDYPPGMHEPITLIIGPGL